jgi:simple sugar transport system permease protein
MGEVFDLQLINTALRQATPLMLAALGGLMSERTGVINIGLEGKILMGAFAGAYGALLTGSPWVGLGCAMLVGLLVALLHAVATQEFRTDHVVSGVAINLLALGLSTYLFRQLILPREERGLSSVVQGFAPLQLGWLERLPVLGALLQDQTWLVPFAVLLPLALFWVLNHTRWGLRVYAVGNDAVKARTMGVPVKAIRYSGVLLSGVLAGMAGAFLTLASADQFRENMSAGRGFIALAALIFGRWHPLGAAAAAFGFGFFEALQMRLQGQPLFGVQLPTDLLLMLPYLLTVIALAGSFGRMKPPSDLGNP